MRRPTRLLALAPFALVGCATEPDRCVTADELPPLSQAMREQVADGRVKSSPLGHFIYVRTTAPYGACAVKFTSLCRFGTEPTSSFATYPHEDVLQRFESYFQGDGSEDFSRTNVVVKSGFVRFGAAGPGSGSHFNPIVVSAAQWEVPCGDMQYRWMGAPGQLALAARSGAGWKTDIKGEIAATTVADPKRIDFRDPGLYWQRR